MKKYRRSLITGFSTFLMFLVCITFSFGQNPLSGNSKQDIEHLQYLIKQTGAKWVAGETSLSKLSAEEFQFRLGLNLNSIDVPPVPLDEKEFPPAIDWRENNGNYVTPARDQKKCGSCWAFAMTAGLESYVLLTQNIPGTDIDLSEQVMVSCSGTGSCSGGYLYPGFIKKTGLPPESYYPYTATDGSCSNAQPGWQDATYKIINWGSVSQDLSKIKTALVQYGPLPTAMMVYEDFKHYKSGIYSYVTGKKLGGHAILLLGYDDKEKYFIVKNSWGNDWGENGFFRIAYSQMDNSVDFGMKNIAYYSKNVKEQLPTKLEYKDFDTNGIQNIDVNLSSEKLENLTDLSEKLSSGQDYSNIQSVLDNFYNGSNSKIVGDVVYLGSGNNDTISDQHIIKDHEMFPEIPFHAMPHSCCNKVNTFKSCVPAAENPKSKSKSHSTSSILAGMIFLGLFTVLQIFGLFRRAKPEIDTSIIVNQPNETNNYNVNSGNQANTVYGISDNIHQSSSP